DLPNEDFCPLRLDLKLSLGHSQVRRPAHGHPIQPDCHRVALHGDDERVPLPHLLLDIVLAAETQGVFPGRVSTEPEEPLAGAESAGRGSVLPIEASLLARRALLDLGLESVLRVRAGDRDVPGGAFEHIALDALQPTLAHGTIRARTVEKQPAVAGGLLPRRPDFATPGVLHPDLVIGILVARNQRAKVLPRDPKDAVADGEVAVGVFVL